MVVLTKETTARRCKVAGVTRNREPEPTYVNSEWAVGVEDENVLLRHRTEDTETTFTLYHSAAFTLATKLRDAADEAQENEG